MDFDEFLDILGVFAGQTAPYMKGVEEKMLRKWLKMVILVAMTTLMGLIFVGILSIIGANNMLNFVKTEYNEVKFDVLWGAILLYANGILDFAVSFGAIGLTGIWIFSKMKQ